MKKRLLLVGFTIIIISSVIYAWVVFTRSNSILPDERNSVIVALESDIVGLDPANLRSPVASRVVWQFAEGLLCLDEEGFAAPLLADSWESSDDFREWTFHIRSGVKFHSDPSFGETGTRAVNAQDVLYSYQRHAKGFGSFVFGEVIEGFDEFVQGKSDEILGIESISADQVRFRLVHPEPTFPYRMTSPYLSIMPKEAVDAYGSEWGVSKVIGTGPFRLESAEPTHIVLTRNKDYWRKTDGNIERLEFRVEKNPELLFRRLEAGDYHVAVLPGARTHQYVDGGRLRDKYSNTLQLKRYTTYNTTYLNFATDRVMDVELRQAVANSIDKNVIVQQLLEGTGQVVNSIVPPGMIGYDSSAIAHREVKSNPQGTLSLLVSDQQDAPEIALVVQSQLADVGVKVEIETLGEEPFISRIFSDNRPDMFLVSSEWVFGAPEFLMRAYDSRAIPNPNLSSFANVEVDELIDGLSAFTERRELNRGCQNIETKALNLAPIVPLFSREKLILMRKEVTGLELDQHNKWDFADVSWIAD